MSKGKLLTRCFTAYMMTAAAFSSASLVVQSPPAEAADTLTSAGECSVSGGSMTLKNDGGWCWKIITVTSGKIGKKGGVRLSSNGVFVASPPQHGQVAIADVEDGKVRIAYRPEAGFTGEDKFTLHNQVRDQDEPYGVSVHK